MPEPDGPGIGLPFLIRVMWSPGRAPVSQASSTEPFPRSAATLTGLAVPATLRPTPTIDGGHDDDDDDHHCDPLLALHPRSPGPRRTALRKRPHQIMAPSGERRLSLGRD